MTVHYSSRLFQAFHIPLTFSELTAHAQLKRGLEPRLHPLHVCSCSAGGLATYLHADLLPSLLPKGIKYKAMADAGYTYMHIHYMGMFLLITFMIGIS
jgi:hypothetical protein